MIKATAITPHTPFNASVFRQEIKAEAKAVAADMKKDFEKTTRTWKHKVAFKDTSTESGDEATASVETKDEIYGYVDQGTKPHIIRPRKRKGLLSFKSKYKAKTTPHVINSHQGGASGKQVFARVVHHPGTDPRYFTRDIQAAWQPKFKKRIESAIARAAKKSGHSASK